MRASLVPLIAVVVSAGWLAAQALDLPVVALLLTVVSIVGSCALAERRGPRIRALLAVLAAGLGMTLGALLLTPLAGGAPLAVMLTLVVVAGALMPLAYAATFRGGGDPP